jgi:5-deoxy-glucuronate isomerase
MDYRKRYRPTNGLTRISSIGDAGMELTEFGILALVAGESFSANSGDREVALVVLGGTCSVSCCGSEFSDVGCRPDVFSGKPSCVYIPAGLDYHIVARDAVEIALAASPASRCGEPYVIRPEQVAEVSVGRDNFQRDAYMILTDKCPARHLFIGEAIVPPGHHASFPPHRHDIDNPPHEVDMEEIYFFRFKPDAGYGLQRIYTDDQAVDYATAVHHNDAVLIPHGYHPVVNIPGYTMYYLWIMAGKNHRQFLQPPDPAHAWIISGK